MGILADFYIAEEKTAATYDDAQECAPEDRAQYKRITPLELSMLSAILDRKAWDVDLMDQFDQILIVDGGERLIHEVSPALVERLAKLSASEISLAATAWSATEEVACTSDEIRPLVEDLVRLAVRARASNRQIFLWNRV